MAADLMDERLFNLFENKWFNQTVIFPKNSDLQTPEKSQQQEQILSPASSGFLVRTFSEESLSSDSDLLDSKENVMPESPVSVLPKASKKIDTIITGKEFEKFEKGIQVQKQGRESRGEREKRGRRKERRERRGKKSLTELEFEELKGFMDLGFVFSDEDKDSSLASIIPGLHRLGKKQGTHDDDEEEKGKISRPYLSESWEVLEERKMKVNPLKNWVISSDLSSDEIAMKNHLRYWAHTVASLVR